MLDALPLSLFHPGQRLPAAWVPDHPRDTLDAVDTLAAVDTGANGKCGNSLPANQESLFQTLFQSSHEQWQQKKRQDAGSASAWLTLALNDAGCVPAWVSIHLSLYLNI